MLAKANEITSMAIYNQKLITEYLKNYPGYLRAVRDATDNTIKDYMHDARRYIEYFKSISDINFEMFEITPKHIRNYLIYLNSLNNDSATIERRMHGLSSFWLYLHNQYEFPTPVPLKYCGIRIRKKRKPTKPLEITDYISILEIIENEISKID